jgi:hypothetical protein
MITKDSLDWANLPANLDFFYPEPEYHPERAEAAIAQMEALDPAFKARNDEARAVFAAAKAKSEKSR